MNPPCSRDFSLTDLIESKLAFSLSLCLHLLSHPSLLFSLLVVRHFLCRLPLVQIFIVQSPMENWVISEIFSIKGVGTFYQKSVGNRILDVVEAQFAYSNQMSENSNPIKSKPNLPKEVSNLVTVSQGDTMVSPSGKFQMEGLSPRKMVKVRQVLSSLDIKVYSRRKSICSTGMWDLLEPVW